MCVSVVLVLLSTAAVAVTYCDRVLKLAVTRCAKPSTAFTLIKMAEAACVRPTCMDAAAVLPSVRGASDEWFMVSSERTTAAVVIQRAFRRNKQGAAEALNEFIIMIWNGTLPQALKQKMRLAP